MEQRTFDFPVAPSGEALRDAALARVEAHNGPWLAGCVRAARAWAAGLPAGREVIGEDVRAACRAAGCGEPGHHNAWGALVLRLLRAGVLAATGRTRKMADPRSHARKSPVYVVGHNAGCA